MRSSNGGWHGLAGWGFRGFSETGAGLRADDAANPLPHAGSSLAAANLRLAELRSVSEIPGAARFPRLLGKIPRRPAVLRHRGALKADQAGRAARRRRRVPAALIPPSRHSGAPPSGEPGIHNHDRRLWIPALRPGRGIPE